MDPLLRKLSGDDLRSDGTATEVAEFVLENPQAFDTLFEGMRSDDDVIRGRTADALEKISRVQPRLLLDRLDELEAAAATDPRPMVRMHFAMTLGHLAGLRERVPRSTASLLRLLRDRSAYVRSWAIVSLCIVARKYPVKRNRIQDAVQSMRQDPSVVIRRRVEKALAVLDDSTRPFPKGWIKSEAFRFLERGKS